MKSPDLVKGPAGAILLKGVRKVYRHSSRRGRLSTLKGALFHRHPPPAEHGDEHFVALAGIDLEVAPGEAVALIGPNGSGKSTMLKLISGILKATAGKVEVNGRVTALIELGAGFHPEITGRENVIINGMLLGLSRAQIEERLAEIISFADIGPYIDYPVSTYSSGMYVRLGFAVAVAVDPEVLLIDEVLAVGDAAFTRRGLDRLAQMRRQGVTMVLVSHDLDLVADFADRALYLDRGELRADGPADTVVARYRSDVAGLASDSLPSETRRGVRIVEEGRRWGNGDVEITDVRLSSGGPQVRVISCTTDCTIHIEYRVVRPVEDFVFGIAWHRADGTLAGGHNTELDGLSPQRLGSHGVVRCVYDSLHLAPGDYLIDVAVHAADGLAYDYWCRAARVRITAAVDWPGLWAPPHRWESDGPEWSCPAATE